MRKRRLSLADVPLRGWRAKCLDCHWTRDFGAARVNCEIGCSRHRWTNSAHSVIMYRYEAERVFSAEHTKERTLFDGEVPF